MKKYWKSVIVLALIVIGLSSYLIQSTLLGSELPRFELEKVSGDESVIESLSFTGNVSNDQYFNHFWFDGEDTKYRNESTFLEDMITIDGPVKQRLIDEYRGFMRGIPYLHHNVYDGEDAVVIVETNWEYFNNGNSKTDLKVSFLDKESEEQQKFNIYLEDVRYAEVIEVQYLDGEIFILSENAVQDGRVLMEYVYDVKTKQIVSEKELINAEESSEYDDINIQKLNESVTYQPMDYMVVRVEKANLIEDEESVQNVIREEHLYRYDLKTGELKDLDLPVEEYGYASRFDGQFIYFEQSSGHQSFTVLPYDLESEEFKKEIVIERTGNNEFNRTSFEVKDQLLYALENKHLRVIDVNTGEAVYEGKIVSDKDIDMESIMFHDMRFE